MAKHYTVTKEINGVKYKAQFAGLSVAQDAVDSTYIDDSTITSTKKLTEYIFEHVIVEPKGLTVDNFDTMEELQEVVVFGREVMQGHFRDKADEGAAAKKG